MVDPETCDTGNNRLGQHVRAIILSSNPALNNGYIELFAQVGVKRHQSQEPDIGRFRGSVFRVQTCSSSGSFETVPCFEEVVRELFLRERLIVDLNAFADEAKMWRGVKSDL